MNSDESSSTQLSNAELSIIYRLKQINDSIASVKYNEDEIVTASSIGETVQKVGFILSDVKGMAHGFKYGLSKGRGFWGKLSMAAVCSVAFGAAYSMANFILSMPFLSNEYGQQ